MPHRQAFIVRFLAEVKYSLPQVKIFGHYFTSSKCIHAFLPSWPLCVGIHKTTSSLSKVVLINLQKARNTCRETDVQQQKRYFTWQEQIHSLFSYPKAWKYPLQLALDTVNNEQKATPCLPHNVTILPASLPVTCSAVHLHKWKAQVRAKSVLINLNYIVRVSVTVWCLTFIKCRLKTADQSECYSGYVRVQSAFVRQHGGLLYVASVSHTSFCDAIFSFHLFGTSPSVN